MSIINFQVDLLELGNSDKINDYTLEVRDRAGDRCLPSLDGPVLRCVPMCRGLDSAWRASDSAPESIWPSWDN